MDMTGIRRPGADDWLGMSLVMGILGIFDWCSLGEGISAAGGGQCRRRIAPMNNKSGLQYNIIGVLVTVLSCLFAVVSSNHLIPSHPLTS